MNLVKVDSFSFDNLKRRVVKFLRYGNSDVQTSIEAMPYGVDSAPIKDMVAVYGPTGEKGKTVILGYLNKNLKAAKGEMRIFSTDENGNLKFDIWLKNDGTCEMGGTADHAVRYQKLDDGLQQEKNLIQAELVKIATAITSLGGAYSPGTVTVDISQAKINEIKTL